MIILLKLFLQYIYLIFRSNIYINIIILSMYQNYHCVSECFDIQNYKQQKAFSNLFYDILTQI